MYPILPPKIIEITKYVIRSSNLFKLMFMFLKKISSSNKIFYTTGRLTSEMVIKTIKMGIPILISRSGFTAWGVELARGSNLTLIGRAKGKKYLALSGEHRIEHK